jgi:hypothetical protein
MVGTGKGSMPSTATFSLRDHLGDDVLLEIVQIMSGVPPRVAPGYVDDIDPGVPFEDDELELFHDWNNRVGRGRGYFRHGEKECRSRRVDLRGPTDRDPGPLPMEEADPDITARHLILAHG